MSKIGLKLWSTNECYFKEALLLYEKGFYDYIELFSVPDSYDECISLWKGIKIPFIIHAPHSRMGLNFSQESYLERNMQLAKEALLYTDTLSASYVIFHPGIGGDTAESARQLNLIKDPRVLVENKPYYSVDDDLVCNGYSVKEIKMLMDRVGIGFCLDFGHAICSANAQKVDPLNYIRQFLELKPSMYHLTDGDYKGVYDQHNHLGEGSFPLKELFGFVPDDKMLTLETDKNFEDSLSDFEQDILSMRKLL